MVSAEASRYSHLRAYREIEPSKDLEKFREKVVRIGTIALGYKDSTFLALPSVMTHELSEDYEPVWEGIGLSAANIYPANRLRYTQFERLAKPERNINKAIFRTYARIMADREENPVDGLYASLARINQKHGIKDGVHLTLRPADIQVSTRLEFSSLGEEYALKIAESPLTEALKEQSEAILQFIRGIGPGSELCKDYHHFEEENDLVLIPFARLPLEVEGYQKEKFITWVASCLMEQPLTLTAGPLEWDPRARG